MGTGINRQSAGSKRPTTRTAEEYRATLLNLAERFPSRIEGSPSAVRDYLNSGRGAGRPYALPPAGFWQMRDQAIADLRAAIPPQKPTRANIARQLGIGVRTLYNYEHRPAGDDAGVRLTITIGHVLKIESGP